MKWETNQMCGAGSKVCNEWKWSTLLGLNVRYHKFLFLSFHLFSIWFSKGCVMRSSDRSLVCLSCCCDMQIRKL